ncbi:MAG: hypothetical protein ONB46_23005 [candidate division KSB1 bacterium]|nr:hypothetical protein [candidate division KSB1 bacterium]MDZ7368711.1 hypothetical protein [candidate division KSB1 bacterium]MDZ7406548.1 hypothetical protein [candidate division KSB1 bacterium]
MQTYTLPRETFNSLLETFGDEKKAEIFAKTLEAAYEAINNKATREITEKKELLEIEIKEDLKHELLTREIFEERFQVVEERFNVVDEKIKSLEKVMSEKLNSLNFKLNIFIAIALIALTFANPTVVQLIGKLF